MSFHNSIHKSFLCEVIHFIMKQHTNMPMCPSRYFPSNGEKIFLFVTDLKLPDELGKLDATIQALQAETDIISEVDSWYPVFSKYHSDYFQELDGGLSVNELNHTQFSSRLTQFLYSPKGARYR